MSEMKVGAPFVSGDLAIVPIEAVQSDSYPSKRGIWAWGFKEPAALVLCRKPEIRAFDILGRELDLEDLLAEVPGLLEVLETVSSGSRR